MTWLNFAIGMIPAALFIGVWMYFCGRDLVEQERRNMKGIGVALAPLPFVILGGFVLWIVYGVVF